ncbi:Rmf/CrpP family protein [Colwellia sp. E2M01]|uniref:Rmf/CrpP family protein n=1 Tax=Colwellia sp. E2M01 TaxID=2841561 RepID=UPI001C090EB1|nr:Rmf/CrpP family protein [Colwellia sp. E2M01]MBU2871980.1 hypothetical protein [Colwellia sp. E2M01]
MQKVVDFELGQSAFFGGKHHSECPFKLPHRKAAWLRGFRAATYENTNNPTVTTTESTHGHIKNLRKLFKPNSGTL